MRTFATRCVAWLLMAVILASSLPTAGYAQTAQSTLILMGKIVELAKAGRYEEVIPLARKLLVEAEKTSGPSSPLTALALQTLGQALQAQGLLDEAEIPLKRLLSIREKTLARDHPDLATPLSSLAQIALGQNRLPAAEKYIIRAIAIQEKAFGRDNLNTAVAEMTLGDIRHRQAMDGDALDIFNHALKIFRRSPGSGDIMAAVTLNNIAEIHKDAGRLQLAEDRYNEALDLQEKLHGRDSLYTAATLNNLGDLHRLRGQFPEAEDLARRALEIREKAFGPGHPDVAASLINLAIVFSKEGRATEAEGLLTRAVSILEKALGRNHPDVATALNNLADTVSGLGRAKEAELLFRRSLAIRERELGPTNLLVASSLSNLSALLSGDNRFSEAEPLARQALAIRESALEGDHPLLAQSLSNLAFVLDSTRRFEEAEPLLKRALAIRSTAFGANHPDVANSLNNLAAHYLDLKDWKAAYGTFADAAAIWIARGTPAIATSPDAGRTEIRANADPFLGMVTAAYRLAQESDGQTAEMLSARAFEIAQWVSDDRTANAISGMSARIAAGTGTLSALVRERQDTADQASAIDRALIAAVSQQKDVRNSDVETALRSRAASVANRLRELDGVLNSQFRDYATFIAPKPTTLAEAKSLLSSNEALILFTPTRDMTFVWTVTRSAVRWHAAPLGAKRLAQIISLLRCGLDAGAWEGPECSAALGQDRSPDSGEPLPFDMQRAYDLFSMLFGSVEREIEGKELILVPSGPLATLPLHVLLTASPKTAFPDGTENYGTAPWLAKKFATAVIPSVAAFKALRRIAKTDQAKRPFIGIGNPLLDGNPGNSLDIIRAKEARSLQRCSTFANSQELRTSSRGLSVTKPLTGGRADIEQLKSQAPLPETANELCAVAQSFRPNAGEVLLGADATESKIKALSESGRLSDYRIVHFATHGALSGQIAGSIEPGLILTPPSLGTSIDDGYLTASEVAGLKLNADWTVLSACNTAGGERLGSEAFSGLARAFFYAGTRTMLVSHWAVNSDATVKIITGTIATHNEGSGITRAEALRRAMVAFLSIARGQESHPATWAPFVIVGESAR